MNFKNLFQAKIKQLVGICLLKRKRQEEIVILMVDGGFCSTVVKYAIGKCFEKN